MENQLSLSAMFRPSMVSGKLGLLREFWLQLSLGSTAQARPGRQDTVYKQLGIERPPAPCSMLHPLLPSLLPSSGSLGSTISSVLTPGVRASRMPASCAEAHGPQGRASGGTVGAECVESSGWKRPFRVQIWIPVLFSADWMIWTSCCTCQGICQMAAQVPGLGAVVRLRDLQRAPGSVLGESVLKTHEHWFSCLPLDPTQPACSPSHLGFLLNPHPFSAKDGQYPEPHTF